MLRSVRELYCDVNRTLSRAPMHDSANLKSLDVRICLNRRLSTGEEIACSCREAKSILSTAEDRKRIGQNPVERG